MNIDKNFSEQISMTLAANHNSRVILNEYELSRATRAILGHMEYKKCPRFNLLISNDDDLISYIEKQPNIYIVTEDIGLPNDVDGVVIKKPLEDYYDDEGEKCNLYLIALSPNVKGKLEKAFTIAHELGHIFLHGKLLEADLMTPRRSLRWYQPTNRIRPLMEAEANIFALYLLIPLPFLDVTYDMLPSSQRKHYIYYIKNILEVIFQSKIDVCMVVARLYLYQLTKNSGGLCYKEIGNYRLDNICRRGHSWIVNGLDSEFENCDGDEKDEPKTDKILIDDILDAVKNRNLCSSL